MTKVSAPYLYRKRGIYYLQKRIPKDLVPHYGARLLQKSLRTKDRTQAVRISSNLVSALEREWQELRFSAPDGVAVSEFLKSGVIQVPTLTEAASTYCDMKGKLGDKRFVGYVNRVVSELTGLVGDKSIRAYTRSDALRFRDLLVARGVAQATVKRNFECIRAIWNFTATENAIDVVNPFSNMNYGNGAKPVRRLPIPHEQLRVIQAECRRKDDEMRWLIAVLSDSGMRLAEAIGLTKQDISLDCKVPLITLTERPWRPLKTENSQRRVPAVGATLWGLKRAQESSESDFLFPRYCSLEGNKSDYASNGLNKWLRPLVPDGCVVHSFRHSFRDRLRAVQCPSDIIDQLGGWKTAGVGQSYGEGYQIDITSRWMQAIVLPESAAEPLSRCE
jgi:integrase